MSFRERAIISLLLISISGMTLFDLGTDLKQGGVWWHVTVEGFVALVALVGVYFLLRGTFRLKQSLLQEKAVSTQLRDESQRWREESQKYIEGLSQAIDQQLNKWGLSPSEKEVAFLLIKGFSLKEIAEIRKTAEKTTRAQATAIYAKAGLSGRSQLAAFFLEDLLMPHAKE